MSAVRWRCNFCFQFDIRQTVNVLRARPAIFRYTGNTLAWTGPNYHTALAGREALMLSLAIVLTIVSAILFFSGLGIGGYVIVTKIRETRRDPGSNARTAENLSTP